MNQEWETLLSELKAAGKMSQLYATKEKQYDMNATVNVWYVIARIEEVLLKTQQKTE